MRQHIRIAALAAALSLCGVATARAQSADDHKPGGLNNASGYMGLVPSHRIGIVLLACGFAAMMFVSGAPIGPVLATTTWSAEVMLPSSSRGCGVPGTTRRPTPSPVRPRRS